MKPNILKSQSNPIEALVPLPLNQITPIPFNAQTPQSEVIQSDMDLANAAANFIYQSWCRTNYSIKELSTLFKMTVDFTKHRRKLLNIPYGEESSRQRRSIVYPVD